MIEQLAYAELEPRQQRRPQSGLGVQSADGEAKFWVEPEIELARNHGLSDQASRRALQLVVDHEQEIRDAWHDRFDG